jgi:hypothetical protein
MIGEPWKIRQYLGRHISLKAFFTASERKENIAILWCIIPVIVSCMTAGQSREYQLIKSFFAMPLQGTGWIFKYSTRFLYKAAK